MLDGNWGVFIVDIWEIHTESIRVETGNVESGNGDKSTEKDDTKHAPKNLPFITLTSTILVDVDTQYLTEQPDFEKPVCSHTTNEESNEESNEDNEENIVELVVRIRPPDFHDPRLKKKLESHLQLGI